MIAHPFLDFSNDADFASSGTRPNVLSVDDDLIAAQLTRFILEKAGFNVTAVESAALARSELERNGPGHFCCLVTDYQMFGENGLELIRWTNSFDADLATIIVSAARERQIVSDALRYRVSNFVSKPYQPAQLLSAVQNGVTETRISRAANKSLRDTKAVGLMQRRIASHAGTNAGTEVQLCWLPLNETGGDFVNLFHLKDGLRVLLAADVSGHDLKAAFVSAYFQGIVRGMLESGVPIEQILKYFNHLLLQEWKAADGQSESLSLAVCAVVIEPAQDRITFHNCGFPAPFTVGLNSEVNMCGKGGGHPLGWFEEIRPETHSETLGDVRSVVLWTDGLEDLAKRARTSPWSAASHLLNLNHGEQACFAFGSPDDVLVACLPLNLPNFAESSRPILWERLRGDQDGEVDTLQAGWARGLKLQLPDLNGDCLSEILLCTREAVLNAMNHGCAGSSDQWCHLQIDWSKKDRLLRVRVADSGHGHSFDCALQEAESPDGLIPAHRGLWIIHCFATSIQTSRNGACLEFCFRI